MIAAVLLAAGEGRRFGGGKLLADVNGRPMAACAMDVLLEAPVDRRIAVVSDTQVGALARDRGFEIVLNDAPQLGLSRSISLGLAFAQPCGAVLFAAADQPLLSVQSLKRLIAAYSTGGCGIACLRDGTHMGNPAVFSSAYFDELHALTGDRGAKGIIRAHPEDVLAVDCISPDELADADDPQTLKRLFGSGMLPQNRI